MKETRLGLVELPPGQSSIFTDVLCGYCQRENSVSAKTANVGGMCRGGHTLFSESAKKCSASRDNLFRVPACESNGTRLAILSSKDRHGNHEPPLVLSANCLGSRRRDPGA